MNTALLTLGLAFGDEGKGTTVDSLCRKYGAKVVVRYNGGPQAAHNVMDDDFRHHTFSQFGSGTLAGAKTFLSRFMFVNPLTMEGEAEHLTQIGVKDCFQNMYIDERAIIVTPWHRITNQMRELARGAERHGSCGAGVGETMKDSLERPDLTLRISDLASGSYWLKLKAIRDYKIEQCRDLVKTIFINAGVDEKTHEIKEVSDYFAHATQDTLNEVWERYDQFKNKINIVKDGGRDLLQGVIVFEGAQGVLLDENWGFPPYNTWTNITFENADAILKEINFEGTVKRIGITRAYTTRHGHGPFVSENDSILTELLTEYHNGTNDWQHNFRRGWLDLAALKYAIQVVGGIDYIIVTHVDYLSRMVKWNVVCSYLNTETNSLFKLDPTTFPTEKTTETLLNCTPLCHRMKGDDVLEWIQEYLNVPLGAISSGPRPSDKIYGSDLTKTANTAMVNV